jgi:hypothetical protein
MIIVNLVPEGVQYLNPERPLALDRVLYLRASTSFH